MKRENILIPLACCGLGTTAAAIGLLVTGIVLAANPFTTAGFIALSVGLFMVGVAKACVK